MSAAEPLPNFSELNIQLFNGIARSLAKQATSFQLLFPLEEVLEDAQAARKCDACPSLYLFDDTTPNAPAPSPVAPTGPKDLLAGGYFRRFGPLVNAEAKTPPNRFMEALDHGMHNGYKKYRNWCKDGGKPITRLKSLEEFLDSGVYQGDNFEEVRNTFRQYLKNWVTRGLKLYEDFEEAQENCTNYKTYYGYDIKVRMDSSEESKENKQSWSQGSISGRYNWFSGKASAELSSLTEKLSRASTLVEGTLYGIGVADISSNRGKWFDINVMDNMKNPDYTHEYWLNPKKYGQYFGKPNGTLLLYNDGLILCGGLKLSINIKHELDDKDQSAFKEHIEAGVWPFFKANVDGKVKNTWSYHKDKGITVTTEMGSALGATNELSPVYVLGVRVADIFSV